MATEESVPTPTAPRRKRWLCFAGFGVVTVLLAAWFCFRPAAPPKPAGTIRTVEISSGESVEQCLSHPLFGYGTIVMSFNEAETDVATFRFVSEQGLEIDLIAPSGIATLGGSMARVFTDSDHSAVLFSPTGAVVFLESDKPPRVVYLERPKVITPVAQAAESELLDPLVIDDVYVMESSLIGDELRLLCTDSDDRGAIVRYRLDFNATEGAIVSAESCDAVTDVSFMTSMNPKTGAWHSLDASVFWRTVDQQTLTCSDGTKIDLPVETLNASTSSLYFALTASPRAGHLIAIRTMADQANIEVVEIDLNAKRLSARAPLKLPTRYINTDVSKLSPDGRFIVLSSRDYRSAAIPFVSQYAPSLLRTTVACDLVLIDLMEWRVAGAERVTSQSFGKHRPSQWWRPTFDHTGQNILLPLHGRYCVINIDNFIRETQATSDASE